MAGRAGASPAAHLARAPAPRGRRPGRTPENWLARPPLAHRAARLRRPPVPPRRPFANRRGR
eukprot:5533493-Lingulodinium_polyedra.AAC.1